MKEFRKFGRWRGIFLSLHVLYPSKNIKAVFEKKRLDGYAVFYKSKIIICYTTILYNLYGN
jgi:hypothetical protein